MGVRQNSSLKAHGACSLSSRGTMEEKGWGEEAVFIGKPLSLSFSPLVPHGAKESMLGKSIQVVGHFPLEKPMKKPYRRILSHTTQSTINLRLCLPGDLWQTG